ncbi:hypothetical protein [Nitrosomonas sp. Nm34]|uniref:hypothetical protein n=1 Tax=Nitrosomonas sp. Nm34 TaxID=1881055 RepID=UPI0011134CD3|nr:hypothetical protein [Nitrosomonas sp. Nm34]
MKIGIRELLEQQPTNASQNGITQPILCFSLQIAAQLGQFFIKQLEYNHSSANRTFTWRTARHLEHMLPAGLEDQYRQPFDLSVSFESNESFFLDKIPCDFGK